MENINCEKIRSELIDYFGTAMTNGFKMAVIDLSRVENASCEELLSMAQQYNIEIEKGNSKQEKKLIYCQKGH